MKTMMIVMIMMSAAASAQTVTFEELSPAVYLHNRNGQPQLARAMERAGVDVAIAVLANPKMVRFADDDDYPSAARARLPALRQQERIAVLQAALMVVANSKDARAFDVMTPYVVNGVVRTHAIERLGAVHDDRVVPMLTALLDDGDEGVASAARAGLGRQRNELATAALLRAWSTESVHRHPSTLLALQQATSPSAHQARGTPALGNGLAQQVCAVIADDGRGKPSNHNDAVILRALRNRCQ